MKRLILLIAALTLTTGALAQANNASTKAERKLARELAYCGVFALNAPRLAQDRAAAEASSKKAVDFVKVAMVGLKVKDSDKLAQEAVAQLNREMNAARDNEKDPEAPVKFLNKTRDDCEKTFNSPAARKAYADGVQIIKKERAAKRDAESGASDTGAQGTAQGSKPEAAPEATVGK